MVYIDFWFIVELLKFWVFMHFLCWNLSFSPVLMQHDLFCCFILFFYHFFFLFIFFIFFFQFFYSYSLLLFYILFCQKKKKQEKKTTILAIKHDRKNIFIWKKQNKCSFSRIKHDQIFKRKTFFRPPPPAWRN